MKFSNTTENALDFVIGGQRYQVAPGHAVDIPSELAYAVKAYGLPLGDYVEPPPPPPPKVREVEPVVAPKVDDKKGK